MNRGARDCLRLTAVAACLTVSAANAAESQFGSHLGTRIAHSDNIDLVSSGNETSESIAEVIAGFNFSRSHARLDANVAYEIDAAFYDKLEDADEIFHDLNANARVGIVPDKFFVDLLGVFDQTVKDPTGRYSFNNLTLTGNRTEVGILGVSPNVAIAAGENVAGELRYSDVKINYVDPTLSDSDEKIFRFFLANSNRRMGGMWGVDYSEERYEYDVPRVVGFKSFGVDLGVWVSPAVRLFTRQGLEGDYSQFAVTAEVVTPGLDEHFWYAGAEWRPDERTMLMVETGNRSFGRAQRLQFDRRLNRSGITLTYDEEPATYLSNQLRSATAAGELAPIDTPDGPNGNFLYLRKGYELAYVLDRPNSSVGVRAFGEERFNILGFAAGSADTVPVEEFRASEFSLRWQFARRNSLTGSAQVARRRSQLNTVNDTLRYFTVEWLHQIGRESAFSVVVAREESEPRPGSGGALQYEENQVILQWERSFGQRPAVGVPPRYTGYVDSATQR